MYGGSRNTRRASLSLHHIDPASRAHQAPNIDIQHKCMILDEVDMTSHLWELTRLLHIALSTGDSEQMMIL